MKVGTVTHYYDKLGVAIVKLVETLKIGDKVKFVRGGVDLFEQEVSSLQLDHKDIDKAEKADEVGVKVLEKVGEGTELYKTE